MSLIATSSPDVLPPETVFGRLAPGGPGPTGVGEFEALEQEDENPLELIGGWVLPMSPGNIKAGMAWHELSLALGARIRAKGWTLTLDGRHRLPRPPQTVVFPDVAIHAVLDVPILPGTESTGRVPEIVIEILGTRSHERGVAPLGAKFLAYQMNGVREYYYTWPDGRDASGFVLRDGLFTALRPDSAGYFASPLLECSLRLVPADIR